MRLGVDQEVAQIPRLVDDAGNGIFAGAPGRGPAGFADHQLAAGKLALHFAKHIFEMRNGHGRGRRIVLPIRQDMDGEVVDGIDQHLRRFLPETPDIGISDGEARRLLHPGDEGSQCLAALFAPQQHFIADDDGLDGAWMRLGQFDRARDLRLVEGGLGADPDAEQHLHAARFGQGHHLVKSLVGGVDAHAIGDRLQLVEILGDLSRRDHKTAVIGRLVAAEGRIAHAMQLGFRRRRQIDRPAEQGPEADCSQARQQQRQSPQPQHHVLVKRPAWSQDSSRRRAPCRSPLPGPQSARVQRHPDAGQGAGH